MLDKIEFRLTYSLTIRTSRRQPSTNAIAASSQSISSRDKCCSSTPLFSGDGGRQKVVCFKAGSFPVRKPACVHKFRQDIELLDQGIIKFAPALVTGKLLVALRLH